MSGPLADLQGRDLADWEIRHRMAIIAPDRTEAPYVALLKTVEVMVKSHGRDGALRAGVVHLIAGAQDLLAGPWGDRLDKGTIDRLLYHLAERLGYDLAERKFTR